MALDLTAIEQAVVEAIKGLGRPYLKSVDSYGGEFDEGLSDVIRKFPAAWVTFAGSGVPKRYGQGSGKWIVPLTFAVMVGARSVRNERSTRQGAVTVEGQLIEPGTYQLLADVEAALLGQDLGLPIDPFAPGKISTLFNSSKHAQGISVLVQEWRTKALITRLEPDAPWLQQVVMEYLVQPSDETADAEDVVELEADGGPFANGSHRADGEQVAG